MLVRAAGDSVLWALAALNRLQRLFTAGSSVRGRTRHTGTLPAVVPV